MGAAVPDGRGGTQIAYDSTQHELVLFGGDGPNGPESDTWLWKNGSWSAVQTDVAPVDRALGAFIYDPTRKVSVLFGGAPVGSWVDSPLNDTWIFDGGRRTWTQVAAANSPSPRSAAAITFDIKRGVVYMYGGYAGQNHFLNDVWTWDGANWSQQASPLPALYPLGLGYRALDDSLLLVGQATSAAGISNQLETWTFVGGNWSQTTPAGNPPCVDHYGGSAEDPRSGSLVFFGGYCGNASVVWNGSAWSSSTPNPSPVARGNEAGAPAMTYDPDLRAILLFGGVANGVYYNDLWEWDGVAWTKSG